jgi:carotenoid cleavage dioxygenase-like enzyme
VPLPRSILDPAGHRDLDLVLAHGTWPDGLDGSLFVSASDPATAPRHAFFGDGVVLRLSLRPDPVTGTWSWRHRVVGTPSRRLREACPDAFHGGAYGWSSPFGFTNSANTAPLPWGDRLFLTWDAGRPVEVDPSSLDFLGEVGHRDSWGPQAFDHPVLPFLPSTAHPVVDVERECMWTVVHDPLSGALSVVRWDGDGTEVRRWPVQDASLRQSIHTVTQTRDWLVLVDCAFRADPAEVLGTGERTLTNLVEEPVWLLRKDLLDATPPGQPVAPAAVLVARPEVNHHYAVWDDADGVRIIFEHTPDTDLAVALRAGDLDATGAPVDPRLHGMYNHPMAPTLLAEYDLDVERGEVREVARAADPERWWATQLSAMDWSPAGLAAPTVHHLLCTGWRPDAVCERALDLYRERVDRTALPSEEVPAALVTFDRGSLRERSTYAFGADEYPTSPSFVPRPGGAPGGHDGWVVVPVLDDGGFRVEVFDAGDTGRGPVAGLRAAAGETVPFLVHSAWVPAVRGADRSGPERLRFADELDDDRLASLPPDLAAAARRVAAGDE